MPAESIPHAPDAGRRGRDARIAILWAAAGAIALAAAFGPRYSQPEVYHQFADHRAILGIPNLLDVASNLAFVVIGAMGLHFVLRGTHADGSNAFIDPAERWGWGVAFASVALTCCGSAYYHWAPDSARLTWDRLPMAVGFMSILAAIVSERIDARAGLRLLVPLALIGAASVGYWRWSAAQGADNLNAYVAVQFGAILLIVLMIALFPARYTRTGDFLGAGAMYTLAKLAEHFDRAIFVATGETISGHTMKHLLAAAGIYWLLRMLRRRRPVSDTAHATSVDERLRPIGDVRSS